VPRLAEVQAHVRDALVMGEGAALLPLLVGGRDPGRRLAVHQRHYRASLVSALLTKFPATAWLMGADYVEEVARVFACERPPAAPCIAEFGAAFPDFIASAPGAGRAPYLRDFAMLEWHLGNTAVAIEEPALSLQVLANYPQDALPDLVLRLQPGVRYLAAGWPVDDLFRLHLQDRAPDRYAIEAAEIRVEIRGARGTFGMKRIDRAAFAFRGALQNGHAIGAAAEMGFDVDAGFDPGAALAAVMGERLGVEANLPGAER
jgi:hypothetical protein